MIGLEIYLSLITGSTLNQQQQQQQQPFQILAIQQVPQFVVIPETQPQNTTTDQNITIPIVISNRNQQVMQFVQISQPATVIATSNVNKVQTRGGVKINS